MSEQVSNYVEMELDFGGQRYKISHLGPEGLRLRDPVELPPGNGTLKITIREDWLSESWHATVNLPEGANPGMQKIPIRCAVSAGDSRDG